MFLCQISRNTTIVPVSICLKVTAVQGAEPTQNYTSDFNGSDMPTDIRATQQRKGCSGGGGINIKRTVSQLCCQSFTRVSDVEMPKKAAELHLIWFWLQYWVNPWNLLCSNSKLNCITKHVYSLVYAWFRSLADTAHIESHRQTGAIKGPQPPPTTAE